MLLFCIELAEAKLKSYGNSARTFRKALEALKEAGIIASWAIDPKSDLVTIERLASVTQLYPPARNASPAAEQTAPPVAEGYDRYLQTPTIEKFRKLYPRVDPYACKSDFDVWLIGKTSPKSYDAAFLGFAEKWTKGKF